MVAIPDDYDARVRLGQLIQRYLLAERLHKRHAGAAALPGEGTLDQLG
jgi:hypothetical protein